MPLISIIVPIFNAEEFLAECIESLSNQTNKNIEIILINDGSTDKSLDICHNYKEKDKRVKVIDQVNQGVSTARNRGIDAAEGTYITFVDSDDYVTKDYCEKMLKVMEEYDTDFVYFGQYSFYSNKLEKIRTRIADGLYTTSQILKLIVDDGTMSGFLLHSTCAVLYKAEILRKYNVRFDNSIHYNEDGYFNLIYSLNSNSIYIKQSDPIYFYRVNKNSASHKILNIQEKYSTLHARIKELDKIYPQYDFYLQLQRRYLTLVLEEAIKMIFLPKKYWINKIRKLLNDPKTIKSFGVLDEDKINMNKRIVLLLLKKKRIGAVYFIIKYLKPMIKRMKRK